MLSIPQQWQYKGPACGQSGLVPLQRPLRRIISAQLCPSQTAEEPPKWGGTEERLLCQRSPGGLKVEDPKEKKKVSTLSQTVCGCLGKQKPVSCLVLIPFHTFRGLSIANTSSFGYRSGSENLHTENEVLKALYFIYIPLTRLLLLTQISEIPKK